MAAAQVLAELFHVDGINIDVAGRPTKLNSSERVLVVPNSTRKSEIRKDLRKAGAELTRYWWKERHKILDSCGQRTGIVLPANFTEEGLAVIFAEADHNKKGGLTRIQLSQFFAETGMPLSKTKVQALHAEMIAKAGGYHGDDPTKPRVTLDMIMATVHMADVLPSPTKHAKVKSPKHKEEMLQTPLTQALVQIARSWETAEAEDTVELKLPTLGGRNGRGRTRGSDQFGQRVFRQAMSGTVRSRDSNGMLFYNGMRGFAQKGVTRAMTDGGHHEMQRYGMFTMRRNAPRPGTSMSIQQGYRKRRSRQKIRYPRKEIQKLPSLKGDGESS